MKVLIVRFSSIGDIVLTFPIVSAIKQQIPNVETHFFTKKENKSLLEGCDAIDKSYFFEKKIFETLADLKKEKYSVIIDLHKNFRSKTLKNYLNVKTYSFPKLNVQKWLYVKLKWNILKDNHIIDRYFKAVEPIGVKNQNLPIQFQIPNTINVNLESYNLTPRQYKVIVLGAKYATKKLPIEKLNEIVKKSKGKIVLLGGAEEKNTGNELVELNPNNRLINLSGKLSLMESAFVLKNASIVLTHDTGLMHIASSFNSKILVVWGNTTGKFGMYPYPNKNIQTIDFEVKNLSCRPCSKIGYKACPKGHFKCMNLQNVEAIVTEFNK